MLSTVAPVDIGKTCMFVTANTQPGVYKRTMIRADVNRLIFPSSFLCPSGYTADANGVTPCAPSASPVVVTLFFRTSGTCSADLIASVRNSLLAFLSDPNQAFGECQWSVRAADCFFDAAQALGSKAPAGVSTHHYAGPLMIHTR